MKLLLVLAFLAVVPIACAQSTSTLGSGVYAIFDTNHGNFTIKLFEDEAPNTVANFIDLATGAREWEHPGTREVFTNTPYYDGLIFHRVIEGFMLQGGDPSGTGMGGPGYQFADEFSPNLGHDKAGILSMANAGPNTNGSQFFITLGPTPHLNGRHSVFGEVVEGMDVVMEIGSVPTGARDRPVADVTMEKVTIRRVD